jgi:hypothetical protein
MLVHTSNNFLDKNRSNDTEKSTETPETINENKAISNESKQSKRSRVLNFKFISMGKNDNQTAKPASSNNQPPSNLSKASKINLENLKSALEKSKQINKNKAEINAKQKDETYNLDPGLSNAQKKQVKTNESTKSISSIIGKLIDNQNPEKETDFLLEPLRKMALKKEKERLIKKENPIEMAENQIALKSLLSKLKNEQEEDLQKKMPVQKVEPKRSSETKQPRSNLEKQIFSSNPYYRYQALNSGNGFALFTDVSKNGIKWLLIHFRNQLIIS